LASYLINRFVKDPCCLKKILNHHSKWRWKELSYFIIDNYYLECFASCCSHFF
jgi:hypothetical protein